MHEMPLVSVVIPTRNSAATLAVCLDSIVHQTYPSTEIVVVDNYSTDTTRDIALAATPVVLTQGPERCAQRNAGARSASGAYVVFIDSDMILDLTVIERCMMTVMADVAIKGVIIPERSVGEGFWAQCKALERSCYVGDDTIEAARFFERSAFETAGGYDETLTAAEDWDLSQRVAHLSAIGRADAYISHLEGRLTLWQTMARKYYYGKTLGRYIQKQPQTAARQLQLIRPAFVRHRRRLLSHPLLLTGMIVMKVSEFAAGAAGLANASWHTSRIRRSLQWH